MHQSICRVILGLNEELLEHVMDQKLNSNDCGGDLNEICNDITSNDDLNVEYPELNKGINLAKSESEWLMANEYLKLALASDPLITNHDLNSSIRQLNDTIYNHFAQNFGFVESLPDNTLVDKYQNHSIKELKKALKLLKLTDSDLSGIKYVSRLVRNEFKTNPNSTDKSFNHDKYFEHNFWEYVKKVINYKESILPTFSMNYCFSYFKNVMAKVNPNYFKFQTGFQCYLIRVLNSILNC